MSTQEFREGAVIFSLKSVPGDSCWAEVIGDKEVQGVICVEFGFAEEVIAMIEFVDGSFLVAIGESLRPYDELYKGVEHVEASKAFLEAIRDRAWYEEN